MATINTDIAQKIDVIIRENNSAVINLVITDTSGAAFDLTGYSLTFKVYDGMQTIISLSNTLVNEVINGITNPSDGTITLGPTGKVVISFTSLVASVNPGTYKHRLVLTKGTNVQTWMYGKFKVNAN